MKTLNLREAAAFLHMHPEEVRTRAKRGLIPGAKVGWRWVFIENDLAEFVRSLYPVKRQALPIKDVISANAGRQTSDSIDEYHKLLGLKPVRRPRATR